MRQIITFLVVCLGLWGLTGVAATAEAPGRGIWNGRVQWTPVRSPSSTTQGVRPRRYVAGSSRVAVSSRSLLAQPITTLDATVDASPPTAAMPAPVAEPLGEGFVDRSGDGATDLLAGPGCTSCDAGGYPDTPYARDTDCQACSLICDGGCDPLWIWPGILADQLSLLGGVHGMKNAANRGADGSFGFHEGLNLGTPLPPWLPPTLGAQIGFEVVHSNLSGADFSNAERNQFFFTTGLFRHADYGLQGGLVFDYLTDDWYFEDLKLTQLRGELSVALSDRYQYGFWFAVGTRDDTEISRIFGPDPVETWETVDIYAFFYRSRFVGWGRGESRLYGGFTGDSDGIIGGDLRVPLHGGWALESEFTFLIPDETTGLGGNENEAWNVGIQLVWYPGSLACGSCTRYYRPMFDVADNGSMIVRRRP